MFSDDLRCFWIFSRYSIDVLLMFSRCSLVPRMFAGFFQNLFRMLRWVLWAWWNLMIISNESMDFNDPKELDDTNYSMIPALRWSPAIWWSPAIRWSPAIWWSPAIGWSIRRMDRKSTVIPSSPMVLLYKECHHFVRWYHPIIFVKTLKIIVYNWNGP